MGWRRARDGSGRSGVGVTGLGQERRQGRDSEGEVGSALEGPIRWRLCCWRVAHLPHQGHAPPYRPTQPLATPPPPATTLSPLFPSLVPPPPAAPRWPLSRPSHPPGVPQALPRVFSYLLVPHNTMFWDTYKSDYPLPRSSSFCHAPLTMSHAALTSATPSLNFIAPFLTCVMAGVGYEKSKLECRESPFGQVTIHAHSLQAIICFDSTSIPLVDE